MSGTELLQMNKKYITSEKDDLFFVGADELEEYYIDLRDDSMRGWSFVGLRAETEENLREQRRDTDPGDLGIDFGEYGDRWFDYNAFADDMEDDWYEYHDVQAERENEDGETLYLGAGSGTDIFCYFEKNKITNYKSYTDHFDIVGWNENEFGVIYPLIKQGQKKQGFDMTDEEKAEEKKTFYGVLKRLYHQCNKCGVIHDVDIASGHDTLEAEKVLKCECSKHPEDEFCQQVLADKKKEYIIIDDIGKLSDTTFEKVSREAQNIAFQKAPISDREATELALNKFGYSYKLKGGKEGKKND